MRIDSSPINWTQLQRKLNPMKPTTKVLTLIQTPNDYCNFARLLYASGYTITKRAEHPRAITLDQKTFGYIECRDETKAVYKFVIYGYNRRHNNARVVYFTNRKILNTLYGITAKEVRYNG